MRLLQAPSTLLSFLAISASFFPSALATEWLHGRSIPQALGGMVRRCANPCGYYGQVCCEASQACLTINDQAVCGNAQPTAQANAQLGGGYYQVYTTTYVETDLNTITMTTSSWCAGQTTQGLVIATATVCQAAMYETQCGSSCCSPEESCINQVCVANGGGSSVYYSSFYTVTTTTSQAVSPPFRGTSSTVVTTTATSSATTTEAFIPPVATNGSTLIGTSQQSSGGGLSGGAIAGIVIGVIAAIILLLLICACCCFKGLLDGLLAIFGLGPRSRRRRTQETIIEERHSHREGGGRTWFGTRPSRVDRRSSTGGGGGMGIAGVGAALATLAVVLGLKRRHDRKHEEKSSYSSSYYDSEYTSSSSASSDRRTRDSRRSRR